MSRSISLLRQTFRTASAVLLAIALSGCLSSREATPSIPHQQRSASVLVVQNRPIAHTVVNRIYRVPLFARVVDKLQDLGYLPITHSCIETREGDCVRHDAFLFPVPASLQKAADAYSWNQKNPFILAAIVQFERQNGILHPTGVSYGHLHRAVLKLLFSTKAKNNSWDWEWVLVNKANGTSIPESLHLWRWVFSEHRGAWIWQTVVNTGVLGSTPNGTWFVYQRLPSTTMQGVFPIPVSWATYRSLAGDQVPQWAGSSLLQPARGIVGGHPVRWQPYKDPGILWVNYFDDGRGIHYYPRSTYGFPQSAGCVEEPYASAPITYRLLHYGVPVTISPSVFHADGFPLAAVADTTPS